MSWGIFLTCMVGGYFISKTVGIQKVFVTDESKIYFEGVWFLLSIIVALPFWYLSSFNVLEFYLMDDGKILFRKIALIFTRDFEFDRKDIDEVVIKEDIFSSGKRVLVRLKGAKKFFVLDLKGELIDRGLFYTLLGISSTVVDNREKKLTRSIKNEEIIIDQNEPEVGDITSEVNKDNKTKSGKKRKKKKKSA